MFGEVELFQEYKGEKIALYGLGTETKKAIFLLEGHFEIVGLLDSFQVEGELYGKEILSLPQAFEKGVRLIIVVARPGSCKAITKKIGEECKKQEVALMDIRGKNLLEIRQITYDFAGVKGSTREELYQKIEQAEVVSFDLFDTLIMREVLSEADILELTGEAWRERGIHIADFVSLRLEAEKRLSQHCAPTLKELYEDILKKIDKSVVSASELAQMEWEMDFKTIVGRQAMCDVFQYCIQKNKAVYIITDTYYQQEQIEAILRKCNLSGYTGLLVSCEHHTGKRQQLFKKLKELEGQRRYLHIGDDLAADIEMAAREGMDTYHVFSGEELLDAVGGMGLDIYMDSLAERLKIGMFAARLFNNPFQFEAEDRKIELLDAYDIGYLICAPIITDFVFWFRERVRQYGIQNIWLCARDGYLLQRMYLMLDNNVDTVYFQTSRIAAIRAGMMNDSDISYVDDMKFGGTVGENLRVRFGLEISEAEEKTGGLDSLLNYRDKILEKAVNEREKYKTYINKLNIKEGDIAFFDFVAKGTTQMYIQKLVSHCLKGLYFLQLEPEFMSDKGLDIESFYGTEETDTSTIYANYYVLETILTAPYPYVCGFDDTGEPVFAKETRSGKDIRCFQRAQEGILDYFRRYLELLPVNVKNQTKKLDEVFLGLIYNLKIADEDFLALIVEDPFFNRMTDITELVCR